MSEAPTGPLPPDFLRERVSGTTDAQWFDDSGARTYAEWSRALSVAGIDLQNAGSVLDFGCGCGRVLRHLRARNASTQVIYGADVDQEAIAWLNANLPGVVSFALPLTAPSQIPDDAFDLIVSQSVFTHLPEDIQFGWLSDLHRVTRRGGVVLTSIHGPKVAAEFFRSRLEIAGADEAERFLTRYNVAGFYYMQGRTLSEQALPEYYGAAFHNLKYIEEFWLPGRFSLLAYLPCASLGHQDILVMRKI